MAIFKLNGAIQNYAWGGTEFIPELLGQRPIGDRVAEYWMGAHEKAPSIVEELEKPLNELIEQNPIEFLGEKVHHQFGRLPFLFKVLDVQDMLSIQVHPTKSEAEKGFKNENDKGIPLSASYRNYKDDNHKPEIMVALGEFWLLHGFKQEKAISATLQSTPELEHLLYVFEEKGYKGLYQQVMEEDSDTTNKVLRPLIDRILPLYKKDELEKSSPEYWASKAFLTFCPEGNIDKGIYSIFFFNIVRADAGQAIFQDAGVPHAYMEGQNIELMANSDNVLRGGLTPKHVDVPELLKHVDFRETVPNVMDGEIQKDGVERLYKSPAPDFELSMLAIEKGRSYHASTNTFEILIVLDGQVAVLDNSIATTFKKGEVIGVTAGSSYSVRTEGAATLYKAKCPL